MQHGLRPSTAAIAVSCLALFAANGAEGIETKPSQDEIRAALDRGAEAAKQHRPPDSFYTRFGATDELHPSGFLITKLAALSVMGTHMGLRGLEPSEADIAQALDSKTMLVSATIFGNLPNFAVDSYMVLDQAGKTIKPVNVRFDAQANRSAAWPEPPRFKAKVVASFAYGDFNPTAQTTITIFPANGGEVTFPVDFSQIK
jgi:hypothetical protein